MTRFMPVGIPSLLHSGVLSGGELIHTIVLVAEVVTKDTSEEQLNISHDG